jgi:hypothetical protein
MRKLFEHVLDLQLQHSSRNTPEMAERGKLIRDAIPEEIRGWAAARSHAVLPFKGRLNVQGRDGTGLKTFVPWVRIYSPELSPSAQSGWYVVYLFRQDGDAVALCISHGSTRFDGGDFKPRTAREAASLMQWGRRLIGTQAASIGMQTGVDLRSPEKLSRAYESTTAFSKTYTRKAIPDDDVLARDAERAVALLGELYRAQALGSAPYSEPPELKEAVTALERISRPGSLTASNGQSFGLNAAERAAVEKRAMDMALAWLAANGFVGIRDVHTTHSVDFLAVRNGVEHAIEVKGTTSSLGKVILTANEVALHHKTHPDNLLIVVHNIELHELRTQAVGGMVHVLDPFLIDDCVLIPLSYMLQLPSQ